MGMYMDKERLLFIKALRAIKEQKEYDLSKANKLGEVYESAFEANLLYNNNILVDGMINFLKGLTNDKLGLIPHFIFELDFGRTGDCVVSIDNEDYDISTSGKLYDVLKTI